MLEGFYVKTPRHSGEKIVIKQSPTACVVNGISGHKNIAAMWKDYFGKLLNSNHDTRHKRAVLNDIKQINVHDIVSYTPCDIQNIIK